jgi:hypothetical protein
MTKMFRLTTTMFACALIFGAAAAGFASSNVASPSANSPASGQAPTTGPLATKATVEIKDANGVIRLKREEQIAFIFLAAIKESEGECGRDAGGPCTIAQLVAGPKPTGSNKVGKLNYDPTTTDPNFTYKLTINGPNWELWVTPKHAGFGGFYVAPGMMGNVYYNPKGAASNTDKLLTETGITGDMFYQG